MKRLTELENYFCSNASKIGKIIYLYDECSSTQDIAKQIIPQCINGTCIMALQQTKGKGRAGRVWFSPPGGLWLSIIIKDITEPIFLNPIFAISAIEVIAQLYQLKSKIYWPNDIHIETQNPDGSIIYKKAGGILTEGIHSEKSLYIAGIGININIEKQYFDNNNLPYATSLYVESGKKIDVLHFLQNFLVKLNFLYELVQSQSYDYINDAFKQYNGLLSKYVKIKSKKCEYSGQVVDVDIKDGILLKLKNNIVENFNAQIVENIKEIEYAEIL